LVAAVVITVALVLLLIAFCGQSSDFVLPGLWGWIYIGFVSFAAVALVWLLSAKWNRKKSVRPGSATTHPD
jgi:ABC-type multidrug transport system permease subunit